jgi:phosphate:Na+ symporter
VKQLSQAVAEFIARLEKGLLSDEVAEQLAKVLRAEQHLLASADQALLVAKVQVELGFVDDAELMQGIAHYRAEVVNLMGMASPEADGFSIVECETQLARVQQSYDAVKAALLHAGAELRIPIPGMIEILEQNSRIRRMARQMFKATHLLSELYTVAEMRVPEVAEEAVPQASDG